MTDTPPAATRTPRWIAVALSVSLAVNLLAAGAFVGAWAARDRSDAPARAGVERMIGRTPFVAALAPEDRRAVLRDLRRQAGPLGENRADMQRRFDALLAAIRAETFDRAAVEALIAESRSVGARRMAIGEAVLVDRLGAMTPAERRAYADRLDRSIRRAPRP